MKFWVVVADALCFVCLGCSWPGCRLSLLVLFVFAGLFALLGLLISWFGVWFVYSFVRLLF